MRLLFFFLKKRFSSCTKTSLWCCRQANKVLKAETDMFAYYFSKLNLSKIQTTDKPTSSSVPQSQSRSSHSVDQFRPTSRGVKSHTVSISNIHAVCVAIFLKQKYNICTK